MTKLRIGMSGFGGFLARKLQERTEVDWVDGIDNIDYYLHLGSPTFTAAELTQHDAQVMHQYVRETIKLVDRLSVPVIFGSTTGVNDIQLDHFGSTSYNLGKLYLENYIINNVDRYMILRIGTIVSANPVDVDTMRSDRIQPQIKQGNLKGCLMEDYYLDVTEFVNTTISNILNFQNGIIEYNLQKITLPNLVRMTK